MNDLISISELLKRFCINKDGHRIPERDCDNFEVTVSVKDIKTIIKEQPTAYSVDKVVEELELHSFELGTDTLPVHYVRLNDAIEIVKQGGVSDVCEWKYTKEIMDNAEFKVGCNTNALKRGVVPNNFSYHDFKYCPYCGKKIKIVGDWYGEINKQDTEWERNE